MSERKFFSPAVVTRIAQGLRYALTGSAPDDWFGPSSPPAPAVDRGDADAAGVAGRRFDYRTGLNIDFRPRSGETVGFPEMRAFADNFDLLRLVIETRKDQLCSSMWAIQPRKEGVTPDERCEKASKFFARPDRQHVWADWLRMLLEDLFVIDAPTLYIRKTLGGELHAVEPIDGATIKPVVDATGRMPIEGTAYQQILKGVPAVDYTREELIYRPRNPRTHKVYGYSPVEQIINTVNIGLRRQIMTTNYFTDGTVPDALAGVPETWTLEHIKAFQMYWDELLSDDMAARRKLKFVPGEIAKNFHETKQPPLKDMFDEWLARIVCYCFSIDATPFVAQVNRAVAETNREQSLFEGRAPLENWVKSVVDGILEDVFGWGDLEFAWKEDEIVDPLKRAERHKVYVDAKVLHPDEVRAELGRPPLTPEQKADMSPPPPLQLAGPNGGADDDEEHKTPGAAGKQQEDDDKTIGKKKARRAPIDRDRAAVTAATTAITVAASAYFETLAPRVAEQIAAACGSTSKADTPGEDDLLDAILAGLDLGDWLLLTLAVESAVSALYVDAAQQAAMQFDAVLSTDALNLANERAVAYAKRRSAEMVGMKWVGEQLVPNPAAKWRIDDATREMLRDTVHDAMANGWSNDEVAAAVRANYAFSESRAETIARTETASADVAGNLSEWHDLGVATKTWLAAPDCCDACQELNGTEVGIDDEFPGGVRGAPLHPRCRCDVLPGEISAEKVEKGFNPKQPRDKGGRWTSGGIGALASSALSNPSRQSVHQVGTVSRSNVESVLRRTNGRVDLSGHRREASDDMLRHAMNSHGSNPKEATRGQRALTVKDYQRLPAVTNKADSVTLSPKKHRGLPVIEYSKEIGGETFVYAEAVSARRYRVSFVSLRVHVKHK